MVFRLGLSASLLAGRIADGNIISTEGDFFKDTDSHTERNRGGDGGVVG